MEIRVAISDSVADEVRRKLAFEKDGASVFLAPGTSKVAVVPTEVALAMDIQETDRSAE